MLNLGSFLDVSLFRDRNKTGFLLFTAEPSKLKKGFEETRKANF